MRSVAERRSWPRELGVVDGGAVGEPRRPPAVCAGSQHRMVTAGQNGEIYPGRMSGRERNIRRISAPRGRRPDVLSAPRNVVAGHDELDRRKPLDEVAQSAPEIARSCDRESTFDRPARQEVTSINQSINQYILFTPPSITKAYMKINGIHLRC